MNYVAHTVALLMLWTSGTAADPETFGEWLRRVGVALQAEHADGKSSFSFSGGTLGEFIVGTDLAKKFNCGLIIQGKLVEKEFPAMTLQGRTLEELLTDIAKKFDGTVLAVHGSKITITDHEAAARFMKESKEPFCLIARRRE